MNINDFVGLKSVTKTLRFSLIPQFETENHFKNDLVLETDEKRAEDYKKAKKLIDRYHRSFIERVLDGFELEELSDYATLYAKQNKSENEQDRMLIYANDMRKAISRRFTTNAEYKKLIHKELIEELLPDYLDDEEEKNLVKSFKGFTTYFVGFNNNRENLYKGEGKSTEIAFRIIDENLPKFLDNCKLKNTIINALGNNRETIERDMNINIEDIFDISYYNKVLRQSGIDRYNSIIGGYTKEGNIKVKGLNEYLNEYNQISNTKTGKMKMLYKQMLSESETISFVADRIADDNQLISCLKQAYIGENTTETTICDSVSKLYDLISQLKKFNLEEIYVKNSLFISDLSQIVYGDWSIIREAINENYNSNYSKKIKDFEKYEDERRKKLNKIGSYSLAYLQNLVDRHFPEHAEKRIIDIYCQTLENAKIEFFDARREFISKFETMQNQEVSIAKNKEFVANIKRLLDATKTFEKIVSMLLGCGTEENKDEVFYGEFSILYQGLLTIVLLYDRIRNYVVKKPYSEEKIKLNFNNSQLLGGWDRNKEADYCSVLLKKDEKYYLAIMKKEFNRLFSGIQKPCADEPFYQKLNLKFLPGPNKMLPKVVFSDKNIAYYAPSKEIKRIRETETFKKGNSFSQSDCHTMIDFYKECIRKNPDWGEFNMIFSDTSSYENIGEFFSEVKNQGYKASFVNVSSVFVEQMVREGKLYLFQIYNKDMSEFSKGTKNLHTLYFEELFSESNLADVIFKLNGEAEMFYRKASLKMDETTIHKANETLLNKNPLNPKKQSCFEYDIVKDKRYTQRHFEFHVPITINFKAEDKADINGMVRNSLKESETNYVIGIDRGERNLIDIVVAKDKHGIVEQYSLNEIINQVNGVDIKTDYHALLDEREKDRDQSRKEWKTIEGIKQLKEGYISQAVHAICMLVEKYNAVIVMEDLNGGFKNSRKKIEKQVYQKFENMLLDKLNLYVNKQKKNDEIGGIRYPYQLTYGSKENKGRQNGIVFYVPAWLTSKIDPVTGFADLLKPKYKNVDETIKFIEKFDSIRFEDDMFAFDLNYEKFGTALPDYNKKWTVWTNGERIAQFRNKQKNNQWDWQRVNITDEFIGLLDSYGIEYKTSNLKECIMKQTDCKFFEKFIYLLKLTLQMRNSVPNSFEDYLISPAKDDEGRFYCSNDYQHPNNVMPSDADANGAFNIARKGLWIIEQLKKADDVKKAKLAISNAEWLEYIQKK